MSLLPERLIRTILDCQEPPSFPVSNLSEGNRNSVRLVLSCARYEEATDDCTYAESDTAIPDGVQRLRICPSNTDFSCCEDLKGEARRSRNLSRLGE